MHNATQTHHTHNTHSAALTRAYDCSHQTAVRWNWDFFKNVKQSNGRFGPRQENATSNVLKVHRSSSVRAHFPAAAYEQRSIVLELATAGRIRTGGPRSQHQMCTRLLSKSEAPPMGEWSGASRPGCGLGPSKCVDLSSPFSAGHITSLTKTCPQYLFGTPPWHCFLEVL